MNSTFDTSGDFIINGAQGSLRVDTEYTTADWDIILSAGKVDVNYNFRTSGDLTMTGGSIEVASGRTAHFDL